MVQTVEAPPTSRESIEIATVNEYRRQKAEAEALLRTLLDAKAECESHQTRFNRPDMFKAVTGRSALDATIGHTRKIIERLELTLAQTEQRIEVKLNTVGERLPRRGRLA